MRKKISEEEILSASWELLATDGIDKFSMRKLSQLLDIKAPSLYWYVKSKEEIFDKLTSQVIQEILYNIEISDQWKKNLEIYGNKILKKLRSHPYSAYLLLQTNASNIDFLKLNNELLLIIENLPFDDSQKFSSINSFLNYIISFEIDYLSQRETVNKYGSIAYDGVEDYIKDFNANDPAARILNNHTLKTMGTAEDFNWGLKIFINGLETMIE